MYVDIAELWLILNIGGWVYRGVQGSLFSTPTPMGRGTEPIWVSKPLVTSRNTLDHADSSRTVHMTSRTRHHLPTAPSHLGPVPRALNLSPRFISLFSLLSYVHFLSHLCLYVTYLFMIQFPLYPFVSLCPYISTLIPDPFV